MGNLKIFILVLFFYGELIGVLDFGSYSEKSIFLKFAT